MNKYQPHVFVIPEDDRDRQLAIGFALHPSIDARRIQVVPPADGWPGVLAVFAAEYLKRLTENIQTHVVLLIDFDGDVDARRARFEKAIPADLKSRVFVIGSKINPEELRKELRKSFEGIGMSLADNCHAGTNTVWENAHLKHNEIELLRLVQIIKPILFRS